MSCYGSIYTFRLIDFLATIDMEEVLLFITSSYDNSFESFYINYKTREVDLDFENFLPATALYRHVASFSFNLIDGHPFLSIDLFDMCDDDLMKLFEYLNSKYEFL